MIHQALAVVRKEFRQMLHERLTLAVTLLLPVFQLLFYGFILETRVRNVPAALVNLDTHQAGRLLAGRIEQSPLFAIQSEYRSEDQIVSGLRTGSLRVGIEIPAHYTASLIYGKAVAVRVWVDGADVATSNYILTALDVLAAEEARSRRNAALPASESRSSGNSGEVRTAAGVSIQSNVLFNPTGRAAGFLLPGLIALLVQAITTLLLAFSFTSERERGTLEQMLISGMPRDAIIAGKCLAVGAVGLVECVFLVGLMRSMFHVQIESSMLLLASIVPLIVLAPLGFGLLIGALAPTQARALQLAPMLFLPSVMLSGFIFPREFLNFPIAWIGNLFPTTYLVALSRTVILRGASVAEAAPSMAISAAFGIAVTAAGWIALRRSLGLQLRIRGNTN